MKIGSGWLEQSESLPLTEGRSITLSANFRSNVANLDNTKFAARYTNCRTKVGVANEKENIYKR